MKLENLGEFGLIDRIAANVDKGVGVVTGIGDDAAVTRLTPGMQLLTSTDMLLEDVHFRRSWHDPYRLGRKSLAVSISDIAAMGGIPRWALLSLAIPKQFPLEDLDSFTKGFLSMAGEHGVSLIGGDTCASRSGLVISVTIMGEQLPELIVRRDGARPGDDIWVTGSLGDAALGLRLLENGSSVNTPHTSASLPLEGRGGTLCNDLADEYLVSRLLDPTPRTHAGRLLAGSGLVTAMIDVSDGILADFGHIAELSGVGGVVRLDALPVSDALRQQAGSMPRFPFDQMLAGGEDYELLFTAPAADREKISNLMKKSGIPSVPVGIVTSLPEIVVLQPDGARYNLPKHGFNHFQ